MTATVTGFIRTTGGFCDHCKAASAAAYRNGGRPFPARPTHWVGVTSQGLRIQLCNHHHEALRGQS